MTTSGKGAGGRTDNIAGQGPLGRRRGDHRVERGSRGVARSPARALADRQLTSWGLSELAFTTELIVSELVTNAIRYAPGTIQVRLIRDRALICEVTDGSSAAPHLRHPRTTDEGGRGLLLVAQLTDRWGTRHTRRGKTIWTEQPLPTHPDGTVPVAPDI
ncbi:ATP-binding protein [Streptomyces mirabilis]|nr:ATP-binding protein [Streptomyces mirabilis]